MVAIGLMMPTEVRADPPAAWCIDPAIDGNGPPDLGAFLGREGYLCGPSRPRGQRVWRLTVSPNGSGFRGALYEGDRQVRALPFTGNEDLAASLAWMRNVDDDAAGACPQCPDPPACNPSPPAAAPPRPPPAPSPLRFRVELLGVYSYGAVPGDHGAGGELRVRVGRGLWSVAASLRGLWDLASPTVNGVELRAGPGPAGVLAGCGHVGWFGACATVAAGAFAGHGTSPERDVTSPLVLAGARIETAIPLGRRASLRFDLDLSTPITRIALTRGRLDGGQTTLWAMSPYVVTAGLGLGVDL